MPLASLFTVMFTIVIGIGLALSRMLTDKNLACRKARTCSEPPMSFEENALDLRHQGQCRSRRRSRVQYAIDRDEIRAVGPVSRSCAWQQ